ncbi:MAG: hypothetical protein GY838_12905 [bacterium]|nr:hypothetical protein [bacterium]
MSPWIPIAVSVATTVIFGLVGFIVKRELARNAAVITEMKTVHSKALAEIKKAQASLAAELKARVSECDARFLSKELFNSLETSRKEVDQLRREADGRLEGLIKDLLSKHGG